MIAPVILASDKTQLSHFQACWIPPVSLLYGVEMVCTDGFVWKMYPVLAAYVTNYPEQSPMVGTGQNGVEMVCTDGFVWKMYPVLAAYVTDYPEQYLVACCMENWCPRCVVSPNDRGSPVESISCEVDATLQVLDQHQRGYNPEIFEKHGLRAVYDPFWRNLPYCNIFACFTPDLLHQLHKGIFKDHLVSPFSHRLHYLWKNWLAFTPLWVIKPTPAALKKNEHQQRGGWTLDNSEYPFEIWVAAPTDKIEDPFKIGPAALSD